MARNKRVLLILSGLLSLLLIPLISMQLTEEVSWTGLDFLVMASLLTALGLSAEWILRKTVKQSRRLMLLSFAVLAFFLIWAELAVGII